MAVKVSLLQKLELVIHGIQAMRRGVERLVCPIQGGSGIGAQFYPHQIQNVQRILSACRVRHLIADEVGMGKTVQALMVANALRLQRGKLKVRIVVPRQELKRQWSSEIMSRAHTVIEIDKEPVGDDWFDIVQVSSTDSAASKLNPTTFDLLILDEPQSLGANLLEYVTRNAYDYTHLLMLTATPELRSPKRLCGLLQILEPAKMERARRELTTGTATAEEGWATTPLDAIPNDTLRAIHDRFKAVSENRMLGIDDEQARWTAGLAEDQSRRFAADAWWTYRNILRSRRVDYPKHLPIRQTQRLSVEPSTGERERLQSIREFVAETLKENSDAKSLEQSADLMRRVVLGGESLQARLRELRRAEAENEPKLVTASEQSKMEVPDVRLDALVDWLIEFWRKDPHQKVVIAAQDNPTVDELARELAWRVGEVGVRGKRIPLKLVSARNEKDDPDSTSADIHASSVLQEFERGDAQLLIAHDAFREAYNLQAAEALIFYSLPWKPEWLDQWIGRVDRLGREVVNPEKARTSPIPVRIITIHRIGDPTERVEKVYHEYRLFEEALDPEANLSERIYAEVLKAGLALKTKAGESDGEYGEVLEPGRDPGVETSPPAGSRWTPINATHVFEQLLYQEPAEPVLRQCKAIGHVSSNQEDALSRWILLLCKQKYLNVISKRRKMQSDGLRPPKYFTMSQDHAAPVRIAVLEGLKPPWIPFFISRRQIERPPREAVALDGKDPSQPTWRRLDFFSHGAAIHDELLDLFQTCGRRSEPLCLRLFALGPRHYPNGTKLVPGTYYCTAGFVDSAYAYANVDHARRLLEGISDDIGQRLTEMRSREATKLRAEFEADQRFVRILVPPHVNCSASQLDDSGTSFLRCDPRIASDLMTPQWTHKDRPNVETYYPPNAGELSIAFKKLIAKGAKAEWRVSREETLERLDERGRLISVEAEERLWNLRAERMDTMERIQMLEAAPSEYNDRIVQLTARPRVELLEDQMQLIERGRDLRIQLLLATKLHLGDPSNESVHLQAGMVIDLRPDIVPQSLPTDEIDIESDLGSVS